MMPVTRVTIHHEGAGIPSDVTRGAGGGYSLWIGATNYSVLRPPTISFATLGFNHVSLDICLSGDRMVCPVTDADLALVRAAVTDARTRGWVVAAPMIIAHRNSPGSSTVCPGDHTMARWNEIVAACTDISGNFPTPPASPEDEPMLYPIHPQVPNKFSGAYVNLAAKTLVAVGGARLSPDPKVITNPNPWLGSYAVPGGLVIVTKDLDTYQFTLG